MATRLPWSRLPSMRAKSAAGDSPSMARCMASIRALRISISSISSAVAKATDAAQRLPADQGEESFPLFFRQLLGVVEPRQVPLLRQDHGSGIHRSRQGAGPRLVHAADGRIPCVLLSAFILPKVHCHSSSKFHPLARIR